MAPPLRSPALELAEPVHQRAQRRAYARRPMGDVQRYKVMANIGGLRAGGGPCEADPDDERTKRYVAKGWLVPLGPELEEAFPVRQAVPAEETGGPRGVAEPIAAPIGDWGLEEDDD